MKRRSALALAATAAWAVRPGLALAQGLEDAIWREPQGRFHLPVRLRWPAGNGPCAAVIYSHGLGGSIDGGDAWAEAWREAGLLVLSVQHPGSDSAIWQGGMAAVRAAASAEQLLARVAHVRFVLDELQRLAGTAAPWSRVQPGQLCMAGHSFGAQTTLALAGRSYPAGVPVLAEPRLKAFIAFSPALGRGDARSPAEQFGAISRPLLAITGSLDGDPLGGRMGGVDRARTYEGLPSGQRALLWLHEADHGSFAGNRSRPMRMRGGPLGRDPRAVEHEPVHHALLARITTLWWRWRLGGDAQAAAALKAPTGLGAQDSWRAD